MIDYIDYIEKLKADGRVRSTDKVVIVEKQPTTKETLVRSQFGALGAVASTLTKKNVLFLALSTQSFTVFNISNKTGEDIEEPVTFKFDEIKKLSVRNNVLGRFIKFKNGDKKYSFIFRPVVSKYKQKDEVKDVLLEIRDHINK